MAVDGDERKVIAKRIAVLYEDALKESEQAVRAWETVLEIDPNEAEALESLAQLHLAAGAYRELAEVYARKIDITDRADERRMLFMQSARIYEQNLTEPDRAIEQLRALLAETPGDGEALADLDRILTAEGRQTDLVEVIDARAAGATGRAGARRARFSCRADRRDRAGRRRGAIGRYAKILAASPQHAGAREALTPSPAATTTGCRPSRVLEPIERAAKAWDGGRRAPRAAPGGRGRGRATAGAARRDCAHRGDRAARRRSGPSPPGPARSPRTPPSTSRARRSSVWRRRARTGRPGRRLRRADGRHVRRRLAARRWRCASLRSTRTSSPILDRAADYLRKAQSLPGDEEPVLASLERVLRKLGKGSEDELGQVLAREAELAPRAGGAGRLPGGARDAAPRAARRRRGGAVGFPRRCRARSRPRRRRTTRSSGCSTGPNNT